MVQVLWFCYSAIAPLIFIYIPAFTSNRTPSPLQQSEAANLCTGLSACFDKHRLVSATSEGHKVMQHLQDSKKTAYKRLVSTSTWTPLQPLLRVKPTPFILWISQYCYGSKLGCYPASHTASASSFTAGATSSKAVSSTIPFTHSAARGPTVNHIPETAWLTIGQLLTDIIE